MSVAELSSDLYRDFKDDELIRLAEETWEEMGEGEPPPGAAELFRYALVRSYESKKMIDMHLWRARALAAAVLTNDRETAALLLLQHFFIASDIAKEESSGYEKVRPIFDEMKRLVPEDSKEWARLFRRLYHDKMAFSLLMQGTNGGAPLPDARGLLEQAVDEYEKALAAIDMDEREKLKVRGGVVLTRYLLVAYDSETTSGTVKEPFLKETREIFDAAVLAGFRDVKNWAEKNLGVMEHGALEGWVPYEVV